MSEPTRAVKKRHYIQALLASTALVSSGTAYAQAEGENAGDRIEEIVVRGQARQYRPEEQTTATGLEMALVDTPQAITVLTGEMLDVIGATSVYEATDLVPGTTKGGYGFGNAQIILRGIANNEQRINGLALSQANFSVEGYALDRIEVVRGPATVVYGVTGSFGGEINSVLKRPEADGHTEIGIRAGSYDSQEYKLDTAGSFSDDGAVRGRLVVKYDDVGLPYDIPGQDIRQEETTFLASLAWDITDSTTATVWYYNQDRDGDAADGGAMALTPSGSLALPQDALNVDPDLWYFSIPGESDDDFEFNTLLAEIEHAFDNDWQLKASTMLADSELSGSIYYPFGPFGDFGYAQDEALLYTYESAIDNKELTFNLSLGGGFELFGRDASFFTAFEYNDQADPLSDRVLNSVGLGRVNTSMWADGTPRLADGTAIVPINRDPAVLGYQRLMETDETDFKLSMQVLMSPTDRLEILAGVLYHDNEATVTDLLPATPTSQSSDFNEFLVRFGATYDLTDGSGMLDDAKLYVSYSEGFTPQFVSDLQGGQRFLPQEMDAFEIGLKGEFLDGAVGASLAYYVNDVENISTSGSELGMIGALQGSQGLQENKGLEFELVGELLPGWNMAFNYSWYEGKITDDTTLADGSLQFPYFSLPRSVPEHSAVVATSYEFLDGPLNGFQFGGLIKYSGDYPFNDALNRLERYSPAGTTPSSFVAGGHTRLDLSASYAGFTGVLEGLKLSVTAVNVTDEEIIAQKESTPAFAVMFVDRPYVYAGFTYTFD